MAVEAQFENGPFVSAMGYIGWDRLITLGVD